MPSGMEEAKTLEENVAADGGKSGNWVANGEVVPKPVILGEFGGALPEQDMANARLNKENTLTDSKSSVIPIDQRLKPYPEPAVRKIEEKQHRVDGDSTGLKDGLTRDEHGLAGQEGSITRQDHVKKNGPRSQDYDKENDVMGQDCAQEGDLRGQDHGHEGGLTGQDHDQESDLTGQDHGQKGGLMGQDHGQESDLTGQEGGLTGQVHGQKGGLTGQDYFQENGPTGQDSDKKKCHLGQQDHVQKDSDGAHDGKINNNERASSDIDQKPEKVNPEKAIEKSKNFTAEIDTAAPFESVKAAVSMFGGIVDWKAHKIRMAERRRYVTQELRKAREQIPQFKKKSEEAEDSKKQAVKELDNAKRLLEELKLNLERAQTEEQQAKQDAELAKLRVEEMEKGIADESSVAAKTQLEVAQARRQAAEAELKTVKVDLENLKNEYGLLLADRDLAIKNAEEAVLNSKEIEKNVEALTIQMITTKEALESAHAAHLEGEEHRASVTAAREESVLKWEEELKQSEEELDKVNRKTEESEELKAKLEAASVLLQKLKAELAAYMEENHKDVQIAVDQAKKDLEELKKNMDKATDEVNILKQLVTSLNLELEKENETLAAEKKKEVATISVKSLEADLKRITGEMELIQQKEKEAREKAMDLPKRLQQETEEADEAKSRVLAAQEELQKAIKAADSAKKSENIMIGKLNVALKDIEAARASEKLALGAISALHESESARSSKSEIEPRVTLSVEEYYDLSRKAKEAEDEANAKVSEAFSQINLAIEYEEKAVKSLEHVNLDLALKKEELSAAMDRAQKAKEGKMAVEQELQTWRSENDQSPSAKSSDNHKTEGNSNGIGSSREAKPRKKKKRSFFPRFFMFFTRKKHSNKNNT